MPPNNIKNDNFMRVVITTAMRPFVRLLLRYGIAFSEFSAIVRRLYVEVAEKEFQIEGRKQTLARIAVLTGITRREVKKVINEPEDGATGEFAFNRAARVFSGWMRDEEFLSANGQPAVLSVSETGPGTFDSLVKKYSGDIPTRAVLDELLRVGAVTAEVNDTISLSSTGYVPAADNAELLQVSFQSVADLITTIDFNDQSAADDSRLQLTVNYDNVTDEGAEIFRILSREKSKEVLLYLDRFLATQDRDSNTSLTGDGQVRTGLSIFYFEDSKNSKDEG